MSSIYIYIHKLNELINVKIIVKTQMTRQKRIKNMEMWQTCNKNTNGKNRKRSN